MSRVDIDGATMSAELKSELAYMSRHGHPADDFYVDYAEDGVLIGAEAGDDGWVTIDVPTDGIPTLIRELQKKLELHGEENE